MYEKIRELCKEKGTSIGALEEKLAFGKGTIYKWKTSSPSVDRLKKVAEALGTTIDELVKEK